MCPGADIAGAANCMALGDKVMPFSNHCTGGLQYNPGKRIARVDDK
jgi:hypothetical protein